MAETFNPADLVPFVENPDPKPTAEELADNRRWYEKEAGFNPDDTPDYEGMSNGFTQLRSLIDSIPTPGRDAGDTLGDFSLMSVAKDALSGTLGLMEAPLKGVIPEKVMEDTLKMGAGAAGINIARGGAAGASAGMFGARPSPSAGRHIHDAFNEKINRASHMESVGDDEIKIWEKTGMSKDHRGDWRYSITENIENPGRARVNWKPLEKHLEGEYLDQRSEVKLGDVLEAPRAYEHWPELKDITVLLDPEYRGMGSYNPLTNSIMINPLKTMAHEDSNQTLRTLVHEAQHALQNMQDRPPGTGTRWIAKAMDERIDAFKGWMEQAEGRAKTNTELAAIRKYHQAVSAWDRMQNAYSREMAAYWASPGEVEARLAEAMAASPGWIGKVYPESFSARNAASAPDPQNRFEPRDIQAPRQEQVTPTGPTDGKKPFGTRVSESRAPYDGGPEGAPNLPANQQRGTLTDDIMDDLSMYQMSLSADKNFYMNYIKERMHPFKLEATYGNNMNVPTERRMQSIQRVQEEIQIRKKTIRALLGEGDDPSVWNAVSINQKAIKELEDAIIGKTGRK